MKKNFFLSATGIALCAGAFTFLSGTAKAQEIGSLYYYPVPQSEYRDNYNKWRVFLEYNLSREQCQHYQEPPPGYVMRGCDVYSLNSVTPAAGETTRTETIMTPAVLNEIVPQAGSPAASYTVYFDFDQSRVRSEETGMLEDAAGEIQRSNAAKVTVSGYADRSGSAEYNQKLSERRAGVVSKALEAHGVKSSVIDREAYGEMNNAVPTADGVKKQENRRVVIEFNR